MGEAYKGLTIRFGADTRSLVDGLRTAYQTIAAVNRQLKTLDRAARLNPEGFRSTNLQMDLLAEKAAAARSRVIAMERAMGELGEKTVTLRNGTTTVKQLAESTSDVTYEAKRANDAYREVNVNLEKMHARIQRIYDKATGQDPKNRKVTLFGDYSNVSESELNGYIEQLRQANLLTDEMYDHWQRLRAEWHKAYSDNEGWKKAQQYRELGVAMEDDAAKAAEANRRIAELASNPGPTESQKKMQMLGIAVDQVAARGEKLEQAMRMNPTSVEAAAQWIKNLGERADVSRVRLDAVEARMKEIGSNSSAMRLAAKNTDEIAAAAEKADAEFEQWNGRFIDAKAELMLERNLLQKIVEDGRQGTEEYEKQAKKVAKLDAKTKMLEGTTKNYAVAARNAHEAAEYKDLIVDQKRYNAELEETNRKLNTLSHARAPKLFSTSGMTSLGMSMYSTIYPATMMVGQYAITAAEDVDAAFRDMVKTVNGTQKDFDNLKQSALEFSQTHFTSADQILEIEAMGGQLGISVGHLKDFAETVSNLDIATNVDADTMAQQLGQLSGILDDLTEDKFSNFGDSLVRLGNNNATLESKIMDVTMRIGSMGSILGMSTPEILAWSTAVASTGQGAEAAGTAVSKTMSAIELAVASGSNSVEGFAGVMGFTAAEIVSAWNTDPAAAIQTVESAIVDGGEKLETLASLAGQTADEFVDAWEADPSEVMSQLCAELEAGGDSLEKFAEVAGMSADEFVAAWEKSPSDALKAFVEGLHRIDEEGGSVEGTLTQLKITSVRQKQALEGLAQTTDVLNNSLTMSSDAWNGISDQWGAAGDAAREADRKAQGFSGSIQMLRNNAQVLLSSFGDSLAPIINKLSDLFGAGVTWAAGAGDGVKQLTALGLAAASALGPVMTSTAAMGTMTEGYRNGIREQKEWAAKQLAAGKESEKSATRIGKLKTSLRETTLQMKLMRSESVLLNSALGILGGVAVMAIVAGVAHLVGEYQAAKKRTDDLRTGTDLLSTAVLKYADSAEEATDAASEWYNKDGGAIARMREDADEYRKTAERITEVFKNANTKSTGIDDYRKTIDTLLTLDKAMEDAGQGERLSAEQTGKLKSAIEGLNSEIGTSYTYNENYRGQLYDQATQASVTADEINKLAEAKRREAMAQAEGQAAGEALQQRMKDEEALAKARAAQADATEKLTKAQRDLDSLGGNTADPRYTEYAAKVGEATKEFNAANKAVEQYGEQLDNSTRAMQTYRDAQDLLNASLQEGASGITKHLTKDDNLITIQYTMQARGQSLLEFNNDLQKAGVSAETFSNLTSDQLRNLAENYDGTFESIKGILIDYGQSIDSESYNTWTSVESLTAAMGSLSQGAQDHLRDAGLTVDDFSKALQDLGFTTETIGQISDTELSNLVMSWDGTSASLVSILENLGFNMETLMREAGEGGNEAMAEGIASTADQPEAEAEAAAQGAVDAADAKSNEADGAGNTLSSAFASGIGELASRAVTEASSMAQRAKDALSVDTESKGINFAQGFISGMGSLSSRVGDAALALARTAAAKLSEGIDEGSPSRVTMRSGRFFGEGFAIGIESQGAAVKAAADEMARGAVDSVDRAMGASDVLMGLTQGELRLAYDANSFNGISASDVFSAIVGAIDETGIGSPVLDIDGRAFAQATVRRMDNALGGQQAKTNRNMI